jgi:hypothetical protein
MRILRFPIETIMAVNFTRGVKSSLVNETRRTEELNIVVHPRKNVGSELEVPR